VDYEGDSDEEDEEELEDEESGVAPKRAKLS